MTKKRPPIPPGALQRLLIPSFFTDNTVEIAKLLAGNKNATLVFYNSTKYADKEVNVTFTVSRVDPTINVRINDTTYPDKAVAEITISDNANGTVNITVDGKQFNATVVNGKVIVNLTGLSGGAKVAEGIYIKEGKKVFIK